MTKFIKKIPGLNTLIKVFKNIKNQGNIDFDSLNQQLQQILLNQYKITSGYSRISDAGFRCFSQFEEDGIILYILSRIGMKTKKVVEICCGDGQECMSANLIINHGYLGFLFDGNQENISRAVQFYNSKKDCLLTPPIIKREWITKENINDLLLNVGISGEIDLLSIDIDGNDYYIWEAISVISPRLVVIETHNIIPTDLSIIAPYSADFSYLKEDIANAEFRSASLAAMNKLAEHKGYRIIGAHKHGFNVFFLRNDISKVDFPKVTLEEIHDNLWTTISQETKWPLVKHKPWISI